MAARMRILLAPGEGNRRTLDEFLRGPQRYVDGGHVFKPGSRGFAVMAEIGGRPCFIKHYRCQGLGYRLRNAFRGSRAMRTFHVSSRLLALGVPVPAPLFCVEERWFRTLGESYLITEFIDRSVDLREFWERSNAAARTIVLRRCAEILGKMHAAGCCHGDLKWHNLLVRGAGEALDIVLVDVDAATFPGRITCRHHETDLERFMRDLGAVDLEGGYRRQFLAEWKQWTGNRD